MAQPSVPRAEVGLAMEEAKKIFDAHREPIDKTMDKKLIINLAVPGSFVDRSHNPYLPVTTKEVVKDVAGGYNAGASMWHFHPRDPETESTRMSLEKRLQIHKEWCDSVFDAAPDIITNVGGVYVKPPTIVGALVDEKSILAETRMAPLIDPLTRFGPNNRYVEVGIVLCHAAAMGRGTNILSFNNKPSITSDVKFLQSRGIRIEFGTFKHSDMVDVKEWVIDTGIARPPMILTTPLGVHNTPTPKPGMEAFELLFSYVRMMQLPSQTVLWQACMGGRYWLPLTAACIALGADIVRVGKEDGVYMYPHRNDYIKECGKAVEAVAGIAKYFGREVATPSEARKILGLPQIRT